MTVYERAKRHFRRTLLLFFAFIPVMILSDRAGIPLIGFLAYGAVSVGMGLWSLSLNCPGCGSNLFMRGSWSMPWPNKVCSRCWRDLAGEGTAT